jgi:leader peptidase (prepilin peptidase) / N-methyltransferase
MDILLYLVCGWLAGYVVNYLADVLPVTRRFSPATCTQCGQATGFWHYLRLQACTACGAPRRVRVFVVQIALTLAALGVGFFPNSKLGFALSLITLTYFALVAVIDLEHRLILHPVSFAGMALGLLAGTLMRGWQMTLVGALAGFGIMFALYMLGVAFSRFRTWRLKQSDPNYVDDDEEAMGFGDVMLAGMLGFFLGWPLIWFGLLLGILLGGAISLLIILGMFVSGLYKKHGLMVFIPYAPYFLLSAIVIIFMPFLLSFLGS